MGCNFYYSDDKNFTKEGYERKKCFVKYQEFREWDGNVIKESYYDKITGELMRVYHRPKGINLGFIYLDIFDRDCYLLVPIIGFIFLCITSIFYEKNKFKYFKNQNYNKNIIIENNINTLKKYENKKEYLQKHWNLLNKSYEVIDELKIKDLLNIMTINEILNIYIENGYQLYKDEEMNFCNNYENYNYKIFYLQKIKKGI